MSIDNRRINSMEIDAPTFQNNSKLRASQVKNDLNEYKNGLADGMMMTDDETKRFANGIIAALNLPAEMKLQFSSQASRKLIPYLMDELGEQGMAATIGVNGTAVIHSLIEPVLTPPETEMNRKEVSFIKRGLQEALDVVCSIKCLDKHAHNMQGMCSEAISNLFGKYA